MIFAGFSNRAVKLLPSILLLSIGFLLLKPLASFQPFLSQGDHGLNLYAIQAVSRGEVPYRDFMWFYGPAMLYYYAFFFKILGGGIQSILIAKLILILLSGVLVYAILSLHVSRIIAATAAIWHWILYKEFFYTYNHTGGIPLVLLSAYLTLRYIRNPKTTLLYLNALCLFVLTMVKWNFGITTLAAALLLVICSDIFRGSGQFRRNIPHYLALFVGIPALSIAVYWAFLHPLPYYYIQQCIPYLRSHGYVNDQTPHHVTLYLLANGYALIKNIFSSTPNKLMCLLILLCSLLCLKHQRCSSTRSNSHNATIWNLTACLLFYLLSLHEFILGGESYQAYWADPLKIILMFGVIGYGIKNFTAIARILIGAIIIMLAFWQAPLDHMTWAAQKKNPLNELQIPPTRIRITNTPEWVQTVTEAVTYLKSNLQKDELFWAIPYDSIYYFLTEKRSPTKELMLVSMLPFPDEQQQLIIRQLEANKINWVLTSDKAFRGQGQLGELQLNYIPLIQRYLLDNFVTEIQFGKAQSPDDWRRKHIVRILKRKIPL